MNSEREYIFVGGAARTGTTLLQSIICALPEAGSFLPESVPVKILFESFDRIKEYDERFDHAFLGEGGARATLAGLLESLLANIDTGGSNRYLVLKHPASTPLFHEIADLMGPRAHFICLLRDPRDVVASMVQWGRRAGEQGRFHWFARRDIPSLCRYFLSFYGPVFAPGKEDRIVTVKYEDLVADTAQTLSGFVSKLGYEDNVLRQDKLTEWGTVDLSAQGPVGDSASDLYGKAVSKARIGTYADILTAAEIAETEACCREYMDRFGYKRDHKATEGKESLPLTEFVEIREPVAPKIKSDEQAALDRVSGELARLREQLAKRTQAVQNLKEMVQTQKQPRTLLGGLLRGKQK